MKIAINGIGVAGPTLAWWLRRYGHQPVLFEKAPSLRTGGYLIDFWGVGYDVAERMELVPALSQAGHVMQALRLLDGSGRTAASLEVSVVRKLLKGRYFSIARGDLASIVYHACADVEARFGCHIVGIDPIDEKIRVHLSDGADEEFDLVVGADGLHSEVRRLAFGPEHRFEYPLGCYVAAFKLSGYRPRDELIAVSYTVPKRQVFRVALPDDVTTFMFIFREELLGRPPETLDERRGTLRRIFRDMGWELPLILNRLDEVNDIYLDRVSQIRMDRWSNGRVVLLGDAAACVSLLAGKGTGLAMTEAYVLAGELSQSGEDHAEAFRTYEAKLRPLLLSKQRAALRMAGFFAPQSGWGIFLRNLATKVASIPLLAKLLLGAALRDDFSLPDYRPLPHYVEYH